MSFRALFFFLPLHLFAAATATGTITDAQTHLPIPGALVQVLKGNNVKGSDTTDGSGVYTITGLSPGTVTIRAAASSYQTREVGAKLQNNQTTTEDIALTPQGGTIAGTVTDASTMVGISGAAINVFLEETPYESTVTNGSGQYVISGIAPGAYIVTAGAANYQTSAQGAVVINGATTTADFALDSSPGSVTGTVTDTNHPPNAISGADISVLDGNVVIGFAQTDAQGQYAIAGLAPGSYSMTAAADGFQFSTTNVSITSGQTATVNFSLASNPGILSGTITSSSGGSPIQGAQVIVLLNSQVVASVLTDQNGQYEIDSLDEGTYAVIARAPTHTTGSSQAVITSGNTTVLNFQLDSTFGSITATVLGACTGQPLAGVLVNVFSGSMLVAFDLTDSTGTAFIDDLAPGSYTVSVSRTNYVSQSATAVVAMNQTTPVSFTLTPIPLPPTYAVGTVIFNQFLTTKERVHQISWGASPSGCLSGYQIFDNGQLIATVPAGEPLVYYVRNRSANPTNQYTIRAVNLFGQVSSSIAVRF